MNRATALRIAIDLVLMPSRVHMLKAEPLPQGVLFLLRIAAGDGEAAQEAAELTGKPLKTVCAAAAFFIEQILLDPECDSYRILGAKPGATCRFTLQGGTHLSLKFNGVAETEVPFLALQSRLAQAF